MEKKYIFITGIVLVVGLIVAFLIYDILYARRIRSFEKEFETLTSQIKTVQDKLSTGNNIVEFSSALKELNEFPNKLKTAGIKLKEFESTENWIKRIWCKIKISQAEIAIYQATINEIYLHLPEFVSRLIDTNTKEKTIALQQSTTLGELNNSLTNSKHEYDTLFSSLQTMMNKSDWGNEKPIFKNIQDDKKKIGNMSTFSLEKIQVLRNQEYENYKSAVRNAMTIKDASEKSNGYVGWLKTGKEVIMKASALGADQKQCIIKDNLLNKDLAEVKSFFELYGSVIESEKRSNELLKDALPQLDDANRKLQNMEKFASSDDIYIVYKTWEDAKAQIIRSKNALNNKGNNQEKRIIWDNLVLKPRANIDNILNEVSNHTSYILSQYQIAVNDESTVAGDMTRDTRRGLNRLKSYIKVAVSQVTNSRIGREISIGVKGLILGTKAFYDLLDPNTDPLTWAFSYEDDVNQLMQETDATMNMDGPSITGKNSIIEDFVNSAYDGSFK